MPLQPGVARCHGYTPAYAAQPVQMFRGCARYIERTNAGPLTPWVHAHQLVSARVTDNSTTLTCAERIEG